MLDVKRLDRKIRAGMKKARIPSISLAVVHQGELIYSRGYGVTSVEDGGLPVTPQTLFRIASTTKPLVATVVLQLAGEGLIDLDRPVQRYLPRFTLSDANAAETMTVRHVMAGTSGLPADNQMADARCPDALECFVRDTIPRYPLIAEPGRVFVYSNPAINVAGHIAETVSGIAFPDLVQQRVFEPLGMERSTFDPRVAMTYPLVQSHELDEAGTQKVAHRFGENLAANPAGGAFSTALDMARYARMLLDGGRFDGRQVLGEAQLAEMTTPQTRTFWPFAPETSYGLALFLTDYKGRSRWGHPGGAGGFLHTFEVMPETRSAVIVQTNGGGGTVSGTAIADAIFDELLGLPPGPNRQAIEPDRSRWPAYMGSYENPAAVYEGAEPLGRVVIEAQGDDLVVNRNGTRTSLIPYGPDFYASARDTSASSTAPGEPLYVGFYRDRGGTVDWISVNLQPARRVE